MKKDDITRVFADATDEQIKALLNINSADITHALGKQANELTEAQNALKKANETIETLEANKGDLEKVQKELDDYKAAEEKRLAEEKAAAERAELMERLDAVLGERKFTHDRLKDIVADDFAKALQDKTNRGKSDADVFESITRDQGYFASQNPPANMAKFGDAGKGGAMDKESFMKLTMAEQTKFKQEHAQEFYSMFPNMKN